jgi:hypothetical protein
MKRIEIKIIVALVFVIVIASLAYLAKNKIAPNDSSNEKLSSAPESSISKSSVLYFEPLEKVVSVGDDFSISAMVDPGKSKVSAITLHIIFDQTKLRLDNIVPAENFSLILAEAKIDNTDGTASIDVAVPPSDPAISEVSKIITLNFHALDSVTNSQIDYTPASQVAADGEMGDVTKTREKVLVTIN